MLLVLGARMWGPGSGAGAQQATFEDKMVDNLKHCLNAVTVQVLINKVYKLQKGYIWHMMHRPRHIPVHKWIASVVKLNNYLTEFPMQMGG
eukprot:5803096-Ditylum_brightwellii.AAC.1